MQYPPYEVDNQWFDRILEIIKTGHYPGADRFLESVAQQIVKAPAHVPTAQQRQRIEPIWKGHCRREQQRLSEAMGMDMQAESNYLCGKI